MPLPLAQPLHRRGVLDNGSYITDTDGYNGNLVCPD